MQASEADNLLKGRGIFVPAIRRFSSGLAFQVDSRFLENDSERHAPFLSDISTTIKRIFNRQLLFLPLPRGGSIAFLILPVKYFSYLDFSARYFSPLFKSWNTARLLEFMNLELYRINYARSNNYYLPVRQKCCSRGSFSRGGG